jgi:hypothetical protein
MRVTKAAAFRELLTSHPDWGDAEVLAQAMAQHPDLGLDARVHAGFLAYYRRELAGPVAKAPKPLTEAQVKRRACEAALAAAGGALPAGIRRVDYDAHVPFKRGKKQVPEPVGVRVVRVEAVVDPKSDDGLLLAHWPHEWELKGQHPGRWTRLPAHLQQILGAAYQVELAKAARRLRKSLLEFRPSQYTSWDKLLKRQVPAVLEAALAPEIESLGSLAMALAELRLAHPDDEAAP